MVLSERQRRKLYSKIMAACEALSISIKFTHNTIRRLFSYADTVSETVLFLLY
jgi:hypothetical protein